jgi:hypothetical protein
MSMGGEQEEKKSIEGRFKVHRILMNFSAALACLKHGNFRGVNSVSQEKFMIHREKTHSKGDL